MLAGTQVTDVGVESLRRFLPHVVIDLGWQGDLSKATKAIFDAEEIV
jgi:hypothetical protein